MIVKDCIQGTLAPYVPSAGKPWNKRRVAHLLNRIAFGGTPMEIENYLTSDPGDIIDALLDSAESTPLPDKNFFPWAEADEYGPDDDVYQQYLLMNQYWMQGMLTEGVRHKLAFFWSNHFVTEASNYGRHSTFLFQYYFILHKNALGNLKTFVKDMGLSPAMLWYLNGNQNTDTRPNENYAREVLELFTMGEGNYSQNDIEELARAFTGWKVNYFDSGQRKTYYRPTKFGEFIFNKNQHDYGEKSLLGITYTPDDDNDGSNDYNMVHDIIFQQKPFQIADYICRKLYKFYVYDVVNEDILEEMKSIFIANDFEIKPVITALLKSEHFFDEQTIGIKIKSHVDWFVTYFKLTGMELDVDYFYRDFRLDNPHPNNPNNRQAIFRSWNYARLLGQEVFQPVNVAGWPGYRTWINEASMVNRWNYLRSIINADLRYDPTKEKYRQLLKDVSGNSNDPAFVCENIVNHFIITGLSPEEMDLALIVFKEPVPQNYFDDGSWNLEFDEVPMQFICLLNYLVTLPEFQLT